MRACVIIPARYTSTRFPGKPLVLLYGKPMILWVAEVAAKAVGRSHVYIATEDERIASEVREAGFSAVMTSQDALTGTDRVAEAAKKIDYEIYVNVQGDEPLINPADICRCIELKSKYPEKVINGYCWIGTDETPSNINIPKVITTEAGEMVYMSRMLLPGYKDQKNVPEKYMKQVCIYGFSREELIDFVRFGRKSMLEKYEDIEVLRFLELGRSVLMYECASGSLAVDVPEDVSRVEAVLQARGTE